MVGVQEVNAAVGERCSVWLTHVHGLLGTETEKLNTDYDNRVLNCFWMLAFFHRNSDIIAILYSSLITQDGIII